MITLAATIAAVGEGLIGAFRSSKRWTSRIATPCMAGLSMMLVGSLISQSLAIVSDWKLNNAGMLLLVTSLGALLYFFVNSLLVAAIPYLKTNAAFHLGSHLRNFSTVGITYAGSSLLAGLLYLAVQYAGPSVLLGALPVVAMLLTTIHYFFRQQDAQEEARRDRAEATEHEQQQLARHMDALPDFASARLQCAPTCRIAVEPHRLSRRPRPRLQRDVHGLRPFQTHQRQHGPLGGR